jgi:phenylalanyl-tRNA synthetase beta chain
MKVTYNWLKDFVDIKVPAAALADKLTMAGLEVTSLEERGGDFIFEIEITSNRPDWLSVAGVAREVAAITSGKLKKQSAKLKRKNQSLQKEKKLFKIEIQDKKDCPLYTAKIIKDVKVGPSPDWLKKRLELLGCRSVNNIVDITNYVLFELGEPLHAFDLDKLNSDAIIIRRAKKGEKITIIDGQEKTLNPEILVIADREKPVAAAGVMGGRDTEVTEGTVSMLLEAAVFDPVLIRRGRRMLGVQSESSYRFERGVDIELVEKASSRAAGLIRELAGGELVLVKDSGVPDKKKTIISLDPAFVHKNLGINIGVAKIKSILSSLDFKVKSNAKNILTVEPPSFRSDVKTGVDLIEEIARIYGYENIPNTLPVITPGVNKPGIRERVALIKNILTGLGLNEVITYSLIDRGLLKGFGEDYADSTEVLNPLSREQEILRPTLTPSLGRCVAVNLNQKQEYINIFEIAKVFSKDNGIPKEELALGIALCGTRSLWFEQGQVKDEAGFLHLKGILQIIFDRLGIADYNFNLTPDNSKIELVVGKEKVGALHRLKRGVLDNLEIKNRDAFIVEVSLEKLSGCISLKRKFKPLPVYPGISRDLSLVLKEDVPAEKILQVIKENAGDLLAESKIIDSYKGKQIPAGFKGLTISCLYRSGERTLTEAEIAPLHSSISGVLADKFQAKLR